MYFQANIILKSNRYHNIKQTIKKIANSVFGIIIIISTQNDQKILKNHQL